MTAPTYIFRQRIYHPSSLSCLPGTFAIQLARHLGATVATTTSAANADLVRRLGAQVVIDYRKDDFEKVLEGYDLVLNSQDNATLEKSLRVVRRGGSVVTISGPPDPEFARQKRLNPLLKLLLRLISRKIRKVANRSGIRFSFLFMESDGAQLASITKLIESDVIRPVIDRVFAFEQLNEALAYVETGRARGKVVVQVK